MNLRSGQFACQRIARKEAGRFFQHVSGREQHYIMMPEKRDVSGKFCQWLGGRNDV